MRCYIGEMQTLYCLVAKRAGIERGDFLISNALDPSVLVMQANLFIMNNQKIYSLRQNTSPSNLQQFCGPILFDMRT
jgi:hypothetical protein